MKCTQVNAWPGFTQLINGREKIARGQLKVRKEMPYWASMRGVQTKQVVSDRVSSKIKHLEQLCQDFSKDRTFTLGHEVSPSCWTSIKSQGVASLLSVSG